MVSSLVLKSPAITQVSTEHVVYYYVFPNKNVHDLDMIVNITVKDISPSIYVKHRIPQTSDCQDKMS